MDPNRALWAVSSAPKPGVIPLRPFGLGEILDGAISYIRANPKVTLGLSAVVGALGQLPELAARLIDQPGEPPAGFPPEFAGFGQALATISGGGITQVVAILAAVVVGIVLTGLLIPVVGRAVLGHRSTFGELWPEVRPRLAGLLGISLITAIGTSLVFGLIFGAGVAAVALLVALEAPVWIAVVVGVLILAAAVLAAAFLWVSWSLTPAVYVLERSSLLEALRRSWVLVRGQRWRVFGILLLAQIIGGLIGGILSMLPSGAAVAVMAIGAGHGFAQVLGLILLSIGTILSVMVTTPFVVGVTGLLYVDQRMRRDGLDIELARHASTDAAAGEPVGDVFAPSGPPATEVRASPAP
jgi:hypothetical protein